MHSRVREHVLGAGAPAPKYTGAAIINTIVERDAVVLPSGGLDLPCFIFAPTGFVGVFPLGKNGDRIAWSV